MVWNYNFSAAPGIFSSARCERQRKALGRASMKEGLVKRISYGRRVARHARGIFLAYCQEFRQSAIFHPRFGPQPGENRLLEPTRPWHPKPACHRRTIAID